MDILQNLISALSLGSLYALLALGIALIFGILRLVNFAYGELIMVGGFVLATIGGVPLPVFVVAALLTTTLVAVAMERVAIRPVRHADATTLLVTSFALSYLLQHLALATKGALPLGIEFPAFTQESFHLGELRIGKLDGLTIVVSVACIVALASFLRKSRLGIEMRAAADDFVMARMVGVRSNRVIASAFAISGLMAGVITLLFLAQGGTVMPSIGFSPMLIGVVATVVGGMSSLVGAALGGYFIGLVTVMCQAYLPAGIASFREAIVYAVVILVLVLRPEGLFTRHSYQPRV